ncbi:FHA domain-containing protein [Microbacterium allomyrinae]|uniref:FHA domain-containing protein n=1 Tax=Microbacterium allomyrinae TaxID=2830666 RepID=A0A9X1LTQ3_9MICO|nr:FHA domain-containing protein [Microbacterium allomyrinae]MCC2031879.1 FHA domain-containing protein [Microbacterium allomyrinae]
MEDDRRSDQGDNRSDIRRAAGVDAHESDRAADTTQTFGHDSDLSFVPFGSELGEAELDAIESLPSGAALLLVRSGPTAGARYLLDTDVTTVGRHPEADIFFDDVTVSRRHAEITRTGVAFELVDQRSLNGTYVNGERVDRAALSNGAEVRVGKFRLNFFVSPADLPQAAEA